MTQDNTREALADAFACATAALNGPLPRGAVKAIMETLRHRVDAALHAPAPQVLPAEPIIEQIKALQKVTAHEYDGEESDGTPRSWRRAFVPLNKVEAIICAALQGATSPSSQPPAPSWQPIETAKEDVPYLVFWRGEGEGEESERYDFDMLEDEVWQKHAERHEDYIMIGGPRMGPGPSEKPPYTHCMHLAAPSTEGAAG